MLGASLSDPRSHVAQLIQSTRLEDGWQNRAPGGNPSTRRESVAKIKADGFLIPRALESQQQHLKQTSRRVFQPLYSDSFSDRLGLF